MTGVPGPPVVVRREGDVALLILDRPEVRNAIDVEMAALEAGYAGQATADGIAARREAVIGRSRTQRGR